MYETPETGEKFGLIAINGDIKDKILAKLKNINAIQGDHITHGGKASPIPMLTLLGGGAGALGISAAASGTLFIATANPATLMAIGNGVGSAVMGTGGIVAQAPFIPVAGALMPVLAPLLAFQVLSTVVILNEFKIINKKLDILQESIDRLVLRTEAEFIGVTISASSRLDSIEKEFAKTNQFSSDVIIRLAIVEDKVNSVFERYKYLYEIQNIHMKSKLPDIAFKKTDAYMTVTLLILDLKIDILRIKLAIQENPGFVRDFTDIFVEKVERYQKLWTDIENSPIRAQEVSRELKDTIDKMDWWKQHMPSWLAGKRKERKEYENQIDILIGSYPPADIILIKDLVDSARQFNKMLLESKEPISLLYWEDEIGKHSYYTRDVIIK